MRSTLSIIIISVIFLLGSIGNVSAATITSCGDVYESSVLGADLTSDGDCLWIGTNDITLDCAGYSITGTGSGTGISIGSSGVTITNCNIENFANGIFSFGLNNVIMNNDISSNRTGIVVFWDPNTVVDNTISSNQVGIDLYMVEGGLVYHNNFINNTYQADDSGWNNSWHHPTLLEGNYWSDYAGVDDGSGTDKHAIAGDGIGDTLIPHPSADCFYGCDYYPFINPNGWDAPDTTRPIVTITSPQNKPYNTDFVDLSFYADEPTRWAGYKLDKGSWTTVVGGSTTLTNLSDGQHKVKVSMADLAGNHGYSTVYFTVDTTRPTVTITSPESKKYTTDYVDLSFYADEPTRWAGYKLDKGPWVTVIGGSTTLTNLSNGRHKVKVSMADLAGNHGSALVWFNVKVSGGSRSRIN